MTEETEGRTPRGIRNSNPGNIRRNGDPWQGLAERQSDVEFFTFKTSSYGIRALARTLITYQDKHSLRTIRQIISRWAPPVENNTNAYVRAVSIDAGLDADQPLDLHRFDHLLPLTKAIIHHENGQQPYTDAENTKALVLAEKEPVTGKRMYSDKDFIDPSDIEMCKDWKGKTQKCFYKTVRCAEFIPREFMPPNMDLGKCEGDLALRGGLWPLQERSPEDQQDTSSPLKMATWMNINGHVIAPLTALMAPQRIISQITTDIMWRMNKAGVPFTYFDKRALSQGGGAVMKQIAADAKQGDPVFGDTSHIGGAQNAVQMVGGGLDPNIFRQWEVLEKMVRFSEEAIGIFSQNSGGPGPANQLVGVKEMQARQQEVMLRTLIGAVQSVMQQQHQQDASAGRRFYAQRRWILENMVGTESAEIIIQSATDELEQFRLTTTIMMDPEQEMQAARDLILMEGGLLDRQQSSARWRQESCSSRAT